MRWRGDDARFSRVVFNEITKNAIQQAFENQEQLNLIVNAQQTCRFRPRGRFYGTPFIMEKQSRLILLGVFNLLLSNSELRFQPEEAGKLMNKRAKVSV